MSYFLKFNLKKILFINRVLFVCVCIVLIVSCRLRAQDETMVLNTWAKYSDARNSLYHFFAGEAHELLELRKEEISRLKTPGQWEQRQLEIKKSILEVMGAFPEKTPLNAFTTGTIKKDGYRIENIIYESLPEFYVTASLFIPDNIKEPAPAILFCSGHSGIAYRRPLYQLPLLNLVKKGFIVLAFDPIGQGERLQYFDKEKGASIIGGATKEHSYPSVQVSLIGQSVARYFVQDGIRGIDYLVSRKEVDPNRIGVHGLSGGGTQTAYISALDDRVKASAPCGYITNFSRLMESIGVQDGEQNFYHGIKNGIDHADFIEVRAPKPTLIMATTRDFFSIQGTRETYEEAKHVYSLFGKPENIEIVEDDYGHGYTKKIREAMYAFFQKHLENPGIPDEEDIEYLTKEELQKTLTGQLETSFEGETVFTLNLKETKKYLDILRISRNTNEKYLEQIPFWARQLSGYEQPSLTDRPVFTGRKQYKGYAMEKYFIQGEGDYVVPYLLLVPQIPNNKSVLYIHPKGKEVVADSTGYNKALWLVKKGFTLLVPDLIGIGELGGGNVKGDAYINNVSYNILYAAMQIGRSIVGVQVSDVIKLAHTLKSEHSAEEVYAVAKGEMSPVLLHAVQFDSGISRISLIEPYSSYYSFVKSRFYEERFVHSIVPGALTCYDLPDLAAAYAPFSLTIAGMTNGMGEVHCDETQADLKIIKDAYVRANAGAKLNILPASSWSDPKTIFTGWLE